jgi:hypothetical protein
MIYTVANSFVIDNVVVSVINNCTKMTPVSLLRKRNIITSHLPVKHFGSKYEDNNVLHKLSTCQLKFEDIQ